MLTGLVAKVVAMGHGRSRCLQRFAPTDVSLDWADQFFADENSADQSDENPKPDARLGRGEHVENRPEVSRSRPARADRAGSHHTHREEGREAGMQR